MTFSATLAAMPHAPATDTGRGFLPPILRTMNHILFLTTWLHAEPGPTDNEARNELTQARDHWTNRTHHEGLSTAATQRLNQITELLNFAIEEFDGWNSDDRKRNIQAIAHRMVGLGVVLDFELLGFTNSDAGSTL